MSKMKRREFLIGGATAVAGLSLFSSQGLRAALAAARQAGKPLLTERNLNSFINAHSLRTTKGQAVSAEAVRDLGGFVEQHFHLTEAQRREFATLSPEDKSKITQAIQEAREKKGRVIVRLVQPPNYRAGSPQAATEANHPVLLRLKVEVGGHFNNLHDWEVHVTITKEDDTKKKT